ncbi:MAG: hypothetical protein V4675_20105 [Verrucomicrobiota bacterium]
MKSETRLPHRKRVWPLLVMLLLLMFWFSRQTATVSPASKVTAAGPSESRLAAVAAKDLTGGDLSPFGGPDESSPWATMENGSPPAAAALPPVDLSSSAVTAGVSPPNSRPMAQVDLAQLLAACPSDEDTPEARQATLSRIRQAIARQASVHGFMVVIDRSMQDEWGVPMVLSARGLFDLTAAVELDLKR